MDLFPALFNHLNRTDEIKPVFIGQYASVDGLPKIDYPPIYYWMDTSKGVMLLSFNEPMLRKICFIEDFDSGLVSDMSEEVMSDINSALDMLKMVTQRTFVTSFETAYENQEKARARTSSVFYKLGKSLSKLFHLKS